MKKRMLAFSLVPLLLTFSSLRGQIDSLGVQHVTQSLAAETREGVGIHSQPFFMIQLANGDFLTVVITQEAQSTTSKELHLSVVNVRNHQALQIPWKEIVTIQRFDPRNIREITNSIAGIHGDGLIPCGTPGLCDGSCAQLCCSGETVLGIVLPSSYVDDGFASFSLSDESIAQLASIDRELLIDQIAFEACLNATPSNWMAFEDANVPNDIVFEDDNQNNMEILATANDDLNEYHVGQLIKKMDHYQNLEKLNREQLVGLLAVDDSTTFDFDPGNDQDNLDDADDEGTDEFVFIASAKQHEDRTIALNDSSHREISPALFKEIAALLLEDDRDPEFVKQYENFGKIKLKPYFSIGDQIIDNATYNKFIEATGYPKPAYWTQGKIPRGAENEGVKDLTLEDARAYVNWKDNK